MRHAALSDVQARGSLAGEVSAPQCRGDTHRNGHRDAQRLPAHRGAARRATDRAVRRRREPRQSVPPRFGVMIVNPALSATILMDPHNPNVTPTAGQVSMFIRQGTNTTQTSFQIPSTLASTFPLSMGCIADNSGRFLLSSSNGAYLGQWIPAFVLESLFVPFGITLDPVSFPFIPPPPLITHINRPPTIPPPCPSLLTFPV